ncbi:hypothetical protein BDB01DRAFT_800828 [Pilobolus umbonatus]|nr:hypothetical protein BDB01DRAFT_800828 [Pilobolus umbonatus]
MPTSSQRKIHTRRVSFDLSHNVVHVLPSLEECKERAKKVKREEYARRTLNEELLNEDIIAEIAQTISPRQEEEPIQCVIIKSCLKKPPVVCVTRKGKKNQKKRKRRCSQGKDKKHKL